MSMWRGHRIAAVVLAALGCAVLMFATALAALAGGYEGVPSPAAHGTGQDGEWLGHAWVDGRKGQSDVDRLAATLRGTGIRDLFVHTGPFRDDGTLDTALRPRARWLIGRLHQAMPGIRVQAWLGAHPVPDQLHLDSSSTRAAIVVAVGSILDDGFDGVHYDFEPVADGDPELLTLLRDTRVVTRQRHALLSISAVHGEPWPGLAGPAAVLPGALALWSGDYLHRVAERVDEVVLMAYDTGLPSEATYGGYVRRVTTVALAAVPADVTLLIGLPAYHDDSLYHHPRAETVAAALRGVRLALGPHPPPRPFGVSLYVDFTVTPADWLAYTRGWCFG
jgi:hypothetical protein